jgi:DNA-binding IclR family transcriptional regulator
MNDYPNEPGYKREGTSSEAAARVAPRARLMQQIVYQAIRQEPGTCQEIADRLGFDRGSVSPRVTELQHLGFVTDSGVRRYNPSGSRATVWRALSAEERMDFMAELAERLAAYGVTL